MNDVRPGRLLSLDDALLISKGRRRRCPHGKSAQGMRAGRPQTRKGRPPPRGPAARQPSRGPEEPRKRKRGTPSGPPLPGAPFAPPRPKPRATRPGGRRRPSLPQGRPCSTLGAGRLNFRVRYGSGCAPAAVAAGPRGALRRGLLRAGGAPGRPGGRTALEEATFLRTVGAEGTSYVSRRARPISGARLRRSRALHLRPINQVVSLGPYRREGPSRGRLPA